MIPDATPASELRDASAGLGKTGFVLAGGGSYGAYQVGVMRALFSGAAKICAGKPMDADLFTGASIGAINAAVMVAHADKGLGVAVEILERIWLNQIAEKPGGGNGVYRLRGLPFLGSGCAANPLEGAGQALRDVLSLLRETIAGGRRFLQADEVCLSSRFLEMMNLSALFDISPLRELLSANLPPGSVERSARRLQVIAANFDKASVRIFENEEISASSGYDPIMASAAIPMLFPPVSIAGDTYVDGGTLLNSPILPASHLASTLHVIYMDPDVEKMPLGEMRGTCGVLDRLLVTNWAYGISQELAAVADRNETLEFLRNRASLPFIDHPRMKGLRAAADAVAAKAGPQERWTQTTIHQYHPTDDLGDITGLLDVRPERISRLIARGYQDAVHHDCEQSGCILPK